MLGVDPSAWFTVIFVPELFNTTCDNCQILNYTYFGEKNLITNGFWLKVKINLTDTLEQRDDSVEYSTTITVFVANSTGKNGISGIMGLAIGGDE